MTLPKYEDYLKSHARWSGVHKGISYEITHHSVSEYLPKGTWCYYINLFENLIEPTDFEQFVAPCEVKQYREQGRYYKIYDYYKIPDLGFHGGITFYELSETICPETGKDCRKIKIGCDYQHAWDRDLDYPYNLERVKNDVITLINKMTDTYKLTVGKSDDTD